MNTYVDNFEYIDVHAHVNFHDFEADCTEVIQRAREQKVAIINVGTTKKTSEDAVRLAEEFGGYGGVYAIVGLHPTEITPENRFSIEDFEPLVAHPRTVAVGECGLDVFRLEPSLDKELYLSIQEEDFRKQIDLAVKYNKPIMIHARESYVRILEILNDCFRVYGTKLRGNAHFFAGSEDEARAFLKLGFTISFTGVITFAKQYEDLVKNTPLESLLSETDCPFVAPVPYRGRRNEPAYVIEVVKKIAEIKGIDIETVKKTLYNNAVLAFGLR
jgi:TatD DNase family protein